MKYSNCFLYGVLVFLMTIVCTSCSGDSTDMDTQATGTASITFNMEGMEANVKTRALAGIDFTKYEVKLYMFSENKGDQATVNKPFGNYTYDQERDVDRSLFTVDSIELAKNYLYVFVAYEKGYADKAGVKVWNAETSTSGPLVANKSLYTHCYIQTMDEEKFSSSSLPVYSKPDGAKNDFMIYGAGIEMPALTTFYTPISVALTRQLGAVEFRGMTGTNASCSVFSEYYRLYLSQMIEVNGAGTQNYPKDYSVMELAPFMTKQFSKNDLNYIIYLPCTTTHGELELNSHPREYANCEHAAMYTTAIETSITIDGTKYSTKDKFPIFPDRKTILTIDDGKLLKVSFTNGAGGVDLEEDWNGMQ